MTDAKPEPKTRKVKVVEKTRGYDRGVHELPQAEADALVEAGVARRL